MLDAPKGYRYWIDGDNGTELSPDAPEWAVKEFQDYIKLMSEESKNDIVVHAQAPRENLSAFFVPKNGGKNETSDK